MRKHVFLLAFSLLSFLIHIGSLQAQWIHSTVPSGLGANQSILASIGNNIYFADENQLFVSDNDGMSWTNITDALGTGGIGAIFARGTNLYVVEGDSIFRSSDSGNSWSSITSGLPPYTFQAVAGDDTDLFAAGSGVFYSINSGANWVRRDTGLPPDVYITALAISGSNIYAVSTFYGIFHSANNGLSWSSINNGLPPSTPIHAITTLGENILVGLLGTEYDTADDVFRSTDSGLTWTQSSTGLSEWDTVWSFATFGSRIFASMDQGGVYCSYDTGKTWVENNWKPYPTPLTRSIATTNQSVFVDTYLRGLWQRPLSDFASVQTTPTLSTETELFPNPTSGFITIHDAAESVLHVSVANVLGSEVAGSGDRVPGTGEISLDLSKLPPGTYFVRITTAEGVVMRKVVKD